jgi:tetrahydromethanopterin S-methyltransferase subunit G
MHQAERDELEESFKACPRYDKHELTDEQIDLIATNAAKKAVDLAKKELYQGVGERVVNWIFWVIGVAVVGLFLFAVKMGWVKP